MTTTDSVAMRELLCGIVEQAMKDLKHSRQSIRRDAERFIDGRGLNVVCQHLPLDAGTIRSRLRAPKKVGKP